MKKIKLFVFMSLLLLLPAVLVGCASTEAEYRVDNAYVIIDINPSVEIITGDDGLVVQVNALNEDAQLLLVETNFVGKTVDQTTTEIVQLAIDMGYIDFNAENAIMITAEAGANTEELETTLSEKVTAFVNERQIKLDVLKATFEATPDMKQLATDLGVSIGKLKLIITAMAVDVDLTLEAGAEMSVRDLNKILIEDRKEIKDFYKVEFKDEYNKTKQQLQFEYTVNKATLLNDAIQNADITVFAELDLTEVQIVELKALYQAYLDELLLIDLDAEPTVPEQPEVDLQPVIDDLKSLRDSLKEQINASLQDIENETARKYAKKQIELLRDQLDDVEGKIEEKIENFYEKDDDNNNGKFNFRFRSKNFNRGYDPYNQVKDLNEKYEDLFEELDIDEDDLEDLFEDQIKDALDTLQAEYKLELESLRLELSTQSNLIKEQLIKEKRTIIDIWKNK